MTTYALAAALAAIGIILVVTAAIVAGVVVRLFRRGPASAEEALARGDSLAAWWRADQAADTLASPRLSERCAAAGRRNRRFGTVMVEERASQPSFAR